MGEKSAHTNCLFCVAVNVLAISRKLLLVLAVGEEGRLEVESFAGVLCQQLEMLRSASEWSLLQLQGAQVERCGHRDGSAQELSRLTRGLQ